MSDPVYLDYNATTPVALEVVDTMLRLLREQFGNPSSSHDRGQFARQAVFDTRRQVAALIGATPEEIVFTGCATEANNLALLGVAAASGESKRHLVVSAVEHPAMMQPALHLRQLGLAVGRQDRGQRRGKTVTMDGPRPLETADIRADPDRSPFSSHNRWRNPPRRTPQPTIAPATLPGRNRCGR